MEPVSPTHQHINKDAQQQHEQRQNEQKLPSGLTMNPQQHNLSQSPSHKQLRSRKHTTAKTRARGHLSRSLGKTISILDDNLNWQEVRLKVQQKLLFVKQSQHEQLSPKTQFLNFPYSSHNTFKFHKNKLISPEQTLIGSIIEDSKGIHLVQRVKDHAECLRCDSSSEEVKGKGKGEGKGQRQRQEGHKGQETVEEVLDGYAVSILDDGKLYEGMYHDGRFCGKGQLTFENGNCYIGHFKQGVQNGQGTYYWFHMHEIYTGNWLGGIPHGLGKYKGKDSQQYYGNFSNGLKFGSGQQHFTNGDKHIGQFVNGVAQGYGEYYWQDGSVYKGDFKNGVRHGYGVWSNTTESYAGDYRIDKKEGYGAYIWTGKYVFRGNFKEDFRQGYGQLYALSSQNKQQALIFKGEWVKGKQNAKIHPSEKSVNRFKQYKERISTLEQQRYDKQRIGHRNCVPRK